MKKKILLFSLLVAILVCAFAICVSAENKIIQLSSCPTLEEIHADREAYVSHLDAYDTSSLVELDATSVIVLSDLAETPTYYVFPAYYAVTGTYWRVNTEKLNENIAATGLVEDFVPFHVTEGNGKNHSFIRVEVPTFVTAIAGDSKFEGSSNVKEIYFPTKIVVDAETEIEKEVTCITNISGQDLFNGCSSLEVIHNTDKMPLGINNSANFAGCKKLKSFDLPYGITSVAGSMFSNCWALESIEIPETVTSISGFAFGECKSLKEITLPNGVISVGKHAFGGCSSLEIMRFSANFTTFSRVNVDYETFSGCNSLKFVYLPATFADSVQAVPGDYKNIFGQSSKTIYFVTENDYDKIVAIQEKFIANKTSREDPNSNIAHADIELYDPNKDYAVYQAGLTKSVIVYGYSACNAFYNNEHIKAEPTYGFNGDKYISNFCSFAKCTRCVDITVEDLVDPLFTSKGYSKSDDAFMYDIKVNHNAIKEYKEFCKENFQIDVELSYGLLVSGNSAYTSLIDAEGKTASDVLKIIFNGTEYTNLQVKFNNVNTEELKTLAVHACAYVIEDDAVSYIGEGVTKTTSTAICFNDIDDEEENVTPPENEEIPQE